MNSTLGIIQLLLVGVAIEGDWMKIHKYMLDRIYIPDLQKFVSKYKQEIDDIYATVSKIEMPSIVEQLKIKHDVRKQIDKFFIQKLGIDIYKQYNGLNQFLKLIQDELFEELKGLCPSNF